MNREELYFVVGASANTDGMESLKWSGLQDKLIIVNQAVNEFFLSEDMENFAIKNDDSAIVAKPLWVSLERDATLHLALILGSDKRVHDL